MTFFKELRRRSKASFQTNDSSAESNATVPTTKSTSSLNSSYGSSTPPSSLKPDAPNPNLLRMKSHGDLTAPPIPPRPVGPPSKSNRNSVMGLVSSSASATTMRSPGVTSPLAPKLTSITDNTVVYQKILLVYGEIGDPSQRQLDGNLIVHHDKDGHAFPPTTWPVSESHFKALVYLTPGWNQIRFDFSNSSLSKDGPHSSYVMLNYLPLNNAPPLQLAVILAKDSPGTYDAVPERIQREGNGLDTALRKYRMAAHLWQAFTAEQMHRNKFGRRCFRFEEEWQTGTLCLRDWEAGNMKNEIKIHIIRSDKSVAEIQNLQIAQQYGPAKRKGELYSIASNAVKEHFRFRPGQKQYVAALFLDSHWDPQVGTIRGHAALGGTSSDLQLAIFGSQSLQSYPGCVEEVVPAFMDCTRTDTRFVANDCNQAGSNWEAVNIGIGAHLHEVGHLLGCPHQESGVMLRDYVRLNRTFMVREAYCTRTQTQGLRVCRMEDECGWHRLDLLRFRHHPCFRLPGDSLPLTQDDSIQFYPIGQGKVLFSAPTGISFIEIYPHGGDETCRHWLDYVSSDGRNGGMPCKITLSQAEIRSRLPEAQAKGAVRLEVFSGGSQKLTIADFGELLSKSYMVSLPARRSALRKDEGRTMNTLNKLADLPQSFDSRPGFKGKKLGYSQLEGSQEQEMILDCANLQTKLLRSIKVYSGYALDGLEFCYEDGQSQLFGKRGGKAGGDEFGFDTRRGETLSGFYLRAGLWIDGVQILTSLGRKSRIYGNPNGGSGHLIMPPPGYTIAGISGSCGKWIDGFQLIVTRRVAYVYHRNGNEIDDLSARVGEVSGRMMQGIFKQQAQGGVLHDILTKEPGATDSIAYGLDGADRR